MTTTLEQQIRGGSKNLNRNLDMTIEIDADLSADQYLPMAIDSGGSLGQYDPSETTVMVGILQNAPSSGLAVLRYAGISNVIYGDTVVKDDLLKIDAVSGRVVPWVKGTDGHTHNANTTQLPSVLVRVVDIAGAAVAGLTDADITARQWIRNGGTIFEATTSTSVTEDGGADGWYEIAVTTTQYLNFVHRISIEPVDPTHIITPPEYPWTPRNWTGGPPEFTSLALVLGMALEDGEDGDTGLIRLAPQLF